MAVSTRTEYALRSLLEINAHTGGRLSAQSICNKQNLPKKYVEHLLNALRNAGLIDSGAGSRGGYRLTRPASEITLLDVMEAVGDDTQLFGCDMGRHFCLGDECRLAPVFASVAKDQRSMLSAYTLERIDGIWRKDNK